MRAALYARVSTIDRDQDPEVQLIKLRDVAKIRGFRVIEEYTDHASGADPNRPGLAAMMKAVDKKRIDVILIVRLDRITRSLINLLNLLQQLDTLGVSLMCTDQPIETTTISGRLMTHILGALAEWEREIIRERIRDGMEAARRRGLHVGRPFRSDKAELISKIKLALRENPNIKKADLARQLNISRGTLYHYIDEIKKRPKGKRSRKK